MLSRGLKRALSDTQGSFAPTFLLPCAASLTTIPHTTDASRPPPPLFSGQDRSSPKTNNASQRPYRNSSQQTSSGSSSASSSPSLSIAASSATTTPVDLSPSIRQMLPLLKSQGPHYITAHIHGHPYLLTQGDTVRLPFLMQGVEPGDIIRLNRAVNIGSRDYTLKASAATQKFQNPLRKTPAVLEPAMDHLASSSQVKPPPSTATEVPASDMTEHAPHYIPNIAKGKFSYLDERLFVCRAVVMGVESEPLRIKEKTKRRQRKVKKVKSKHRFTILRVKEVLVRDPTELEAVEEGEEKN